MFKPAKPVPVPQELRWCYATIKPGETMRGWVLGPTVGVLTHYFDQTKPCRHCLTDGALACVLGKKCKPRWRGYLPFYDQESKQKTVVMVSESLADLCEKLSYASPVLLVRPKRNNNPPISVITGEYRQLDSNLAMRVKKGKPHDIRPWLLHLWQDRVLTEALGSSFSPSPRTESGKQRFE